MTTREIQQQLDQIRTLIEKGRREAEESGRFFLWMGLISLATLITITRLEAWGLSSFIVPTLIVVVVLSGFVGYMTVNRMQARAGARSYPVRIVYGVWLAVSIPSIVCMFLFPMTGVYPWSLVPTLTSLFVGAAVFATGLILESPVVTVSGCIWWAGGIGMALVDGSPRAWIMAAVILLGWILPGATLNQRYQMHRRNDV